MSDKNRKYRLKPVWIGNGPAGERAPSEPSAVIQIDDLNGGFLTSRLTTVQRDAIVQPADGLLIWNTDTNQLEVFGSGMWSGTGGGGGGAVGSIFGRVGNVIATAGDYNASQITVTPAGNLIATTVQAALIELQLEIDALPRAINDLTDVDTLTVPPVSGQTLLWNGTNWVPGVASAKKQDVVANIVARDALPSPQIGDYAYVTSAIADPTVVAGAALYVWDGLAWQKIAEFESLDIPVFSGTNGIVPSNRGLVPVAAITDGSKFLAGNATWQFAGKNRTFASNTAVAPAVLGLPSITEIQTYATANLVVDSLVYYTGTNTSTDTPTHVYWADQAGAVTVLRQPGTGAAGIDDVLAVGQPLTAARTMDANGQNYLITNTVGTRTSSISHTPTSNIIQVSNSTPVLAGSLWIFEDLIRARVTDPLTTTTMYTRPDVIDVESNGLGMRMLTRTPLLFQDSTVNTVGFRAPVTVTTNALWNLPPADGLNTQVLTTNGTGDLSWTYAGKDREFASNTAVAPFVVGAPDIGEVTAWSITNNIRDTLVYYTGNDTSTDSPTYVWWIDRVNNVTMLRSPASAGGSGIDDVLAVGQALTANRSITTTGRNLFITGTTGSVLTPTTSAISHGPNSNQMQVATTGIGGTTATILQFNNEIKSEVSGSGNFSRINVRPLSIDMEMDGVGTGVRFMKRTGLHFMDTGSAASVGFRAPITVTGSIIWSLPPAEGNAGQSMITDGSGNLSWGNVGKFRVFADNTSVAPAVVGKPTISEIATFASLTTPDATRDTLIYYTGTDIGTDTPTRIYWIDQGGIVTLVNTTGIDDVLALGQALTANRTITTGGNSLTINNNGVNDTSNLVSVATATSIQSTNTPTGAASTLTVGSSAISNVSVLGANTTNMSVRPTGVEISSTAPNGLLLQNQTPLLFQDSTTNTVGFRAPATVTFNTLWTLPPADGANGQALSTDGAGNLSWATSATEIIGAETAGPTVTAQPSYLYPINTTAAPVTVTLPTGPTAGDSFTIVDSRSKAGINNITVDFVTPNVPLHGIVQNFVLNAPAGTATFTYISATVGWIVRL